MKYDAANLRLLLIENKNVFFPFLSSQHRCQAEKCREHIYAYIKQEREYTLYYLMVEFQGRLYEPVH
jgi:hypothetical protein